MSNQHFSLKWGNHSANMVAVFDNLLSTGAFVDVTLACEGLSLKAHKIVLSASSSFFQDLFLENPCKHPIVILKDVSYQDLKSIVYFMYHGEVNLPQHQLSSLLKIAEILKVKGLTEVSGGSQDTPVPQAASTPQNVQPNTSSAFQPHLGPNVSIPTPMHAKRKRVRSRKISTDFSFSSNEEVVPTKVRELQSPEIEEIIPEPAGYGITSPPGTSASGSSKNSSTKLQSFSSKHCLTSKAHSQDLGYEDIDPSKLLEQSLGTETIPSSAASHSNVPIQTGCEVSETRSDHSVSKLSCCSQSPSLSQKLYSPQDIELGNVFENKSAETSSSNVDPSMPGTSQEPGEKKDNTMVPQDQQSQGASYILQQSNSSFHQYHCQYCPFSTNSFSKLQNHEKIHARCKIFTCPICFQTFNQKGDLNRHILIHTGEKPFNCKNCGKSFNQPGNLKRHRILHCERNGDI